MTMSFFEDNGSSAAHPTQPLPISPATHSFYPPVSDTRSSYHDQRLLYSRPQGATSSHSFLPQAPVMSNTSNAILDYPFNYTRRHAQVAHPEIVHPSGELFTAWNSRNGHDSSQGMGVHRMQPPPPPSSHVSSTWHSPPSLSHTASGNVEVYSRTPPEPVVLGSSPPSLAHQYRRLPQREDGMVALRTHFHPRGTEWECLERYCGRMFRKQSDAHDHFLREHLGKSKLFECIDCAAQFSSEATARRHQDNQVKRYSCHVPGCSKKFARADYRNFHERSCSMSRIGSGA